MSNKKIKWYNRVLCFFLGHQKDIKKVIDKTDIIINCKTNIKFNTLDTGDVILSFIIPGHKFNHILNFRGCNRCSMYKEYFLQQNPDWLTPEEEMIKDIIE